MLPALGVQGKHREKVCPGKRVLRTRCRLGVPCTSAPPDPWCRLPGQRLGHRHLRWLMVDGGAGTVICQEWLGWARG